MSERKKLLVLKLFFLKLSQGTNKINNGIKTIENVLKLEKDVDYKKNKTFISFYKDFEEIKKSNITSSKKIKDYLDLINNKIKETEEMKITSYLEKLEKEGFGKPVYINMRIPHVKYLIGYDEGPDFYHGYFKREGIIERIISKFHDVEKEVKLDFSLYNIKQGCIPFATSKKFKGYILTFSSTAQFLINILRNINFVIETSRVVKDDQKKNAYDSDEVKRIGAASKEFNERIKNTRLSTLVKVPDSEFLDNYIDVYMMLYRFRNKCTEEWEKSGEFIEFRDLPEGRMAF